VGWRITDWHDFEPSKQNDRDQTGALKYWKCPVSQNRRYKLLVLGDPKGWLYLSFWHAIVASWGRQTQESREDGVLRTASAGDHAATLEELAADTLIPAKKLQPAISKFLQMGWLCLDSKCIPNGIQMYSDTRLDKTRLDKTKLEEETPQFLSFPEIEYVQLTEQQYQKLCDKWGKDAVDNKIPDLDYWLCHNPKKRQGRDCYKTLNAWLRKDGGQGDPRKAVLALVCRVRQAPDHIKEGVERLLGVFSRWPATEAGLDFWVLGLRVRGTWLTEKDTKEVVHGVEHHAGIEPNRDVLAECRHGIAGRY